MNKEQNDHITALAREYAEECAEEVGVMFNPQNWACSKCEIEAKAVIIWLLRRFYLVEKSKIREAYRDAQKDQYNSERDFALTLAVRNRSAVLIDLFPEIAKDVEDA